MTPVPPSYALTIALHPDGWQLHTLHGGKAQSSVRLTVSATEQIARVIGDAVISEGLEVTPFELVRKATEGMKARVDAELRTAEETAKTIPALRKTREEIENIQ
jgi:hypothetical protein